MSGWSKEEILNFLKYYQREQCICDPAHSEHKNKEKVAEAWSRLGEAVGKPVANLKSKKQNLMRTFRRNFKQKQECISSGGMNGTYHPNWFAYQLMESFLLPIYAVQWGVNSEMSFHFYKNKEKVAEAWSRLGEAVGKPVANLKSKKQNLMRTFRRNFKQKQECISSGGMNGTYHPNWFAYQLMESFLLPIYAVQWGLNSEMLSDSSEAAVHEDLLKFEDHSNSEPEETENDISLAGPSTSATAVSASFRGESKDKCSRRPGLDSQSVEQQMATAFNQITLNQRRTNPSDAGNEEERDLYTKILAKMLRELPNDERMVMVYEIYGLFIQKIERRRFVNSTPSSSSCNERK